jgi:hypothetical protein
MTASATQATSAGPTIYAVCLYNGAGTSAGELTVDRAGDSCGSKPCWKTKGDDGLVYSDPDASASGVAKLTAKGGDAGKGKLSVSARNKASKGQIALPALAAGLAGQTSATAQVATSDGACFELALSEVKQADVDAFKASGP